MKPIILIAFCCLTSLLYAQPKLGLQLGVGTALYNSDIHDGGYSKNTITGGLSLISSTHGFLQYGVAIYTEQYVFNFLRGYGGHVGVSFKQTSEDARYVYIAPVIAIPIVKYVHLNIMPSAGFLLSGSETTRDYSYYNYQGTTTIHDSIYNTTDNIKSFVFRIALEAKGYIPISKKWWVTISHKFSFSMLGGNVTSSKASLSNREKYVHPGYPSLQVGVAHRLGDIKKKTPR